MSDPWRVLYCNAHAGHREVMPCYTRPAPAIKRGDGRVSYLHGNGHSHILGQEWVAEAFEGFQRHRDFYGNRTVHGTDPDSVLEAVTAVASWLKPIHREPPPDWNNRRVGGESPWRGGVFNVHNVAPADWSGQLGIGNPRDYFGKLAAYAADTVVFPPARLGWRSAWIKLNLLGLGPAPGQWWGRWQDVGAVCWQHALTSPDFAPPGGWALYDGVE